VNIVELSKDLSMALPNEDPFCQIVGKNINFARCDESQGQDGCFGCAALTRLCENCQTNRVDIPAVGLCSLCAVNLLKEEKGRGKPEFKNKITISQCRLKKGKISSVMCFAAQGQDECKDCQSSYRLCEKCKDSICRFPQYGLCLRCSILEYGQGWDPKTVLPAVVAKKPAKAAIEERFLTVVPKKSISIGSDGRMCLQLTAKVKKPLTSKKLPVEFPARPALENFLAGRERISISTLSRGFGIKYADAKSLMNQLESERLVGPALGKAPRHVLFSGKRNISKSVPGKPRYIEPTMKKKIDRLRLLANTIGDSELTALLNYVIKDLRKWKAFKAAATKIMFNH
jgi:hypothetical protein